MAFSEHRDNIRDELKELAPNLAKLRETENPLEVPLNYFDQLSAELLQKVREEQARYIHKTTVASQPFWQKLLHTFLQPAYAMTLAGVAILIIGLSIFTNKSIESPPGEIALSEQEISDYIEFHLDDFDLNLLAEESSVDPTASESLLEDDGLETNELEDYFNELLDEVDLEDLL